MSSCELNLQYNINKFHEIKSYLSLEGEFLGPDDLLSNCSKNENDGNKCCTSISIMFSFMCIGKGTKVVFLQGKPPSEHGPGTFETCWKGQIAEESDRITAVLCIPMASKKESSFGDPDWFCVIVGFRSGKVSFYTENGLCLITNDIHSNPVIDIQSTSNLNLQLENKPVVQLSEICILCEDVIVVINGNQLFLDLGACRNQLAVASAYGETPSTSGALTYKKFKFVGQDVVSGVLKRGLVTLSPFDDLQSLTINGGYKADISISTSPLHELVTTGSSPYVGCYLYPDEAEFQLSYVASAVANKLKNAFYSAANNWWNWKQKEVEAPIDERALQTGTPINIVHGVPDNRRCGNSVCLAPGCNWLAAVTDSFGRVVLLDITDGCILRMWKGYRDAQVSFIRVYDDTTKDKQERFKTSSLFLLVFAPKRRILEVWCCINGPRVATFNIRKTSQLLRVGDNILGLMSEQLSQVKTSPWCCVLSDDGKISSINIPFHAALSDATSNRARHIHLLKKINSLLLARTDEKEIMNLILKMDICSFQQQALEKLMKQNNIQCHTIRYCIESILERLASQVVEMHENILKLSTSTELRMKSSGNLEEMDVLESEIKDQHDTFLTFYQFVDMVSGFKNEEYTLSNSLMYFGFNEGQCNLKKWIGDSVHVHQIGGFLFKESLKHGLAPESFLFVLAKFKNIENGDLLILLFRYFLETETGSYEELVNSAKVVLYVMKLMCTNDIAEHGSFTCLTMIQVVGEKLCQERTSTPACLMAASVCKLFCIWYQDMIVNRTQDVGTDKVSDTNSNTKFWSTVIKRLKDCLYVNVLLSLAYHANHDVQIQLASLISVSDVLRNGKGHIPELISRYFQNASISSQMLYSDFSLNALSQEWKQYALFWRSHMSNRLQFCLNENMLLAHWFWDKVVEWNKTPMNTSYLLEGISHLKQIKNTTRLQHGLSLMAWRAFINKRAKILANLMEKMGKLPKDRLCVKEVGIHADKILEFCHCCYEILQIVNTTDPNRSSDFSQPDAVEILSGYDNFQCWGAIVKKESIVEIAEVQPPCSTLLTCHRLCLAMVLKGLVKFEIHGIKPLSRLFGSNVSQMLFSEVVSTDFVIPNEKQLCFTRTEIFCSILSKALKTAGENESTLWFNMFKMHAPDIIIDVEQLTIYYVEQLFKQGLDVHAYKFVKMIPNDVNVTTMLLSIIGKRLAIHMKNLQHNNHVMIMSQMSPPVASWITKQDADDVLITDLGCCRVLANYVISLLADGSDRWKFAVAILDTLSTVPVPEMNVD